MTWGRHSAMASATAREPSICLSMGGLRLRQRLRIRLGRGGNVTIRERLGELVLHRGDDRIELDDAGQRCKSRKQRNVGHGAADVLQCESAGAEGVDAVAVDAVHE